MLKKHTEFFKSLLFLSDLVIIFATWIFAYWLRFYSGLIPIYYGIAPLKHYLLLVIPVLVVWALVFKACNLYRPRRISTYYKEVLDIAKACTMSIIILVTATYFFKKFAFSRLFFLYFWVLSIVALSLSRGIFREALQFFRRSGYNLRHIIIIGDGTLVGEFIERLSRHPEVGLKIIGLISSNTESVGKKVHGNEIIGTYENIASIIEARDVDQVFIGLPFFEIQKVENFLNNIGDKPVSVKIIPDVYHFPPFCNSVEAFEGLPILNIQDTPLYGWDIVIKRLFDILIASFSILITLPLMVVIAVITKLTSLGPVLYRQKRSGLDGKIFEMLKFRTMCVGAEKETGPVWARENDPRRTKFGAFLRRTSLDELPQFFNVLEGDMSVVGPRPERPELIKDFKDSIPRYVLRHKMKAGITGWAQVNGWRGNTSLEERIKHDIYYIENWSTFFDIKIVWLTIYNGFTHTNAY